MINVLIVDDEKIEREGLKYLISTETKEHKIFVSFQWQGGAADSA